MKNSTSVSTNHIPWVDVLRITACFMVVISHSCDFFVSQFDENRFEFLSGAAWGSLMRSCVPLFVMISGVLLLPVKTDTATFYKRRLGRIIWPLVVWSLITPLLYFAYSHFSTSELIAEQGANTGYYLLTWPLNFNYATTPLWYMYMLVGLYLIMPIISPWLAQASRKDIKRFLYIWGITLFLPAVQLIAPMLGYEGNYGNRGLLGVCDWNPYGTFYYFAGFLGYMVLAHYRTKYPLNWSAGKTFGLAIPLFIAGYALTFGSFTWLQTRFPGDYAYLEIPWYFTGFNVFMMTYAAFIMLQRITIRNESTRSRLNKIASLTFGVYLIHFFVVQLGYDFVHQYIPLPPYLQIPIIALLAFTVTALVVRLLQYLPKHKYLIG